MPRERQFTVIVREAKEGGYWAEVVELPGCVSQGESREEVHANVVEAIQACLAAEAEIEEASVERIPVAL